MSTFITLVNFISDHFNYILFSIILTLLIVNSVVRQNLDYVKKYSFKLASVVINDKLRVFFCVKYNTKIDLNLFFRNIENAINSSKWNPENKSFDDPELINLQRVLIDFGYYNVMFTNMPEQIHPMGIGINALKSHLD